MKFLESCLCVLQNYEGRATFDPLFSRQYIAGDGLHKQKRHDIDRAEEWMLLTYPLISYAFR